MTDFHSDLSVPGHDCIVSYNAGTRSRTLTCGTCSTFVATILMSRSAAKQERDAWQKHLDEAQGGAR